MKHIFILVFALFAFTFVGCSNDDDEPTQIDQSKVNRYWEVNMKYISKLYPYEVLLNCTDTVYDTEYHVKSSRENCSPKIQAAMNEFYKENGLYYSYSWKWTYTPLDDMTKE